MAIWQQDLVLAVRALISDLGSVEIWTDARIQQCIVVSALIVQTELKQAYDYSIDLSVPDISPDPVTVADNNYLALIMLKSACILTMNKYQDAAGNAVVVRNSDDMIDTTKSISAHESLMKLGPCKMYQDALLLAQRNKSMISGKLITGPMSHPDFFLSTQYGLLPYFGMLGIR